MKRRVSTIVIIEGIDNATLAAHVYRRITETLTRVTPTPVKARVTFSDENGPKGGADTRCTIVFHIPRHRDLSVTKLAGAGDVAFDAARATLELGITRETERRREMVRRPKKYFVAERLLEGDGTAPTPSTRLRRARRRKVA
jgi:putative sigma-54 modulation protein